MWSDCLRAVGKVSTIEDFWSYVDRGIPKVGALSSFNSRLYRIIQEASTLQVGSDYYFFKENIRPEWEDEMNCNGGRWIVTVDRNSHRVDTIWLELLVAMLGEQFGIYSDQICGATVNIRHRGFKVCLWTKDALNQESNIRIGQIMKEKLGIQESISYESHADAGVKHDSTFKAKYKV
uniref:eIF-4F 25 kDa subunit n=1 Tax=Trichuris muris TaxID=70415 RepID=A0A5S6Q4N4_TRIMR